MALEPDYSEFYKLSKKDIPKASALAGKAFQNDPNLMYFYPEREERQEKGHLAFRMIYQYGIKHGVTYATSPEMEGIIVWHSPKALFPSTWKMMRQGGFGMLLKVGFKLKLMKQTIAVFDYMDRKHKELVPADHWYLQNLAVNPSEQRKGYGGRLIQSMVSKIHAAGFSIYLETNNPANLSFYKRNGFEILDHSLIPTTPIPLWCLVNPPK